MFYHTGSWEPSKCSTTLGAGSQVSVLAHWELGASGSWEPVGAGSQWEPGASAHFFFNYQSKAWLPFINAPVCSVNELKGEKPH